MRGGQWWPTPAAIPSAPTWGQAGAAGARRGGPGGRGQAARARRQGPGWGGKGQAARARLGRQGPGGKGQAARARLGRQGPGGKGQAGAACRTARLGGGGRAGARSTKVQLADNRSAHSQRHARSLLVRHDLSCLLRAAPAAAAPSLPHPLPHDGTGALLPMPARPPCLPPASRLCQEQRLRHTQPRWPATFPFHPTISHPRDMAAVQAALVRPCRQRSPRSDLAR